MTFSETELLVDEPEGSGTVNARFSEPGEYRLLVQAMNDPGSRSPTGGFEFLCCWTNGYVNVIVH